MNKSTPVNVDSSDDSPLLLDDSLPTQAACTSSSTLVKKNKKRKLNDTLGKDKNVIRREDLFSSKGSTVKKNKKADPMKIIIANAHEEGSFVNGVWLVDLYVQGVENKRRKFEDATKLTQWLLDDAQINKLKDPNLPRMDVCHIGDVVQERVLRHLAALEKSKEWNTSRMRATFAAIRRRVQKLRTKGIDVYGGGEGTPKANKSIRNMFKRGPTELFTQPEHEHSEEEVVEIDEQEQGG